MFRNIKITVNCNFQVKSKYWKWKKAKKSNSELPKMACSNKNTKNW